MLESRTLVASLNFRRQQDQLMFVFSWKCVSVDVLKRTNPTGWEGIEDWRLGIALLVLAKGLWIFPLVGRGL